MRFEVVIPVVNVELANELLASISRNTLLPKRVLIIDNSEAGLREFDSLDSRVNLKVYTPNGRLGVNASWNLGIENAGDCDAISILNDDVVLGREFFSRNAEIFRTRPDCAVACPATSTRCAADAGWVGPLTIFEMDKREGWAFTIRRDVAKRMRPIPAELQTFCGDDWIWAQTRKMGFKWLMDYGNVCYHHVGKSVKALGVRPDLLRKKRAFNRLVRE